MSFCAAEPEAARVELPYDSRDQLIYRKDLLMAFAGTDGSHKSENPRHEPGEPTHPGIDREHHHD